MGGMGIGEPHYDGGAPHAIRAKDRWPRTGFLEKSCGKIAAAAVILWVFTCSEIKITDYKQTNHDVNFAALPCPEL